MNDVYNFLATNLRPAVSGKQLQLRVEPATSTQKVVQTIFLVLALLCFFAHSGMAQGVERTSSATFGLSLKDLRVVMQKSLDLPALQRYYPRKSDKSLKPLNIVQMPLALPAGLELAAGGKPVNLISISRKEFSKLSVDSYAMFRSIETAGNTVQVRFNQFYKPVGQSRRTVFVTLELQNSAKGWNVLKSTVKEAAL